MYVRSSGNVTLIHGSQWYLINKIQYRCKVGGGSELTEMFRILVTLSGLYDRLLTIWRVNSSLIAMLR